MSYVTGTQLHLNFPLIFVSFQSFRLSYVQQQVGGWRWKTHSLPPPVRQCRLSRSHTLGMHETGSNSYMKSPCCTALLSICLCQRCVTLWHDLSHQRLLDTSHTSRVTWRQREERERARPSFSKSQTGSCLASLT